MNEAASPRPVSTFIQILVQRMINDNRGKTEMSRPIPKALAGTNSDQQSQFAELVAAEFKKVLGVMSTVTVQMNEVNFTTIEVAVTIA